jgi:hypothetical protein
MQKKKTVNEVEKGNLGGPPRNRAGLQKGRKNGFFFG